MTLMAKAESTCDAIRRHIREKGSATGPELAGKFGVSRQAVSQHLRRLIADGAIFRTGSTRAARYFPAEAAVEERRFRRDFALARLDESEVWDRVAISLSLGRLPGNVGTVLRYAFTEILNNAIEHSHSKRTAVDIRLTAASAVFSVRDSGIGVFHSIADKFGLEDEQAAMIELVKGKTTTQPDAHSGEGIFFVSRAADRFVLRSHRLQIDWDHTRDDVFVSDPRFLEGTLARFEIRRNSRTRLDSVFAEFAPEKYDFRFEKTRVLVKLLRRDYVSRSEAKRLLHNLDRFSEIELDMRDVVQVGQGFADEVFRVFASRHPAISVRALNAGAAVEAMIRHVRGTAD
jgi:anti-sigma regulatory factor (Ser/Thr protein kinase)